MDAPEKQTRGRPTDYNAEIAETICLRMADGETLLDICDDEDMPARATVYKWRAKYPEFKALLDEARQLLCHYWAEQIVRVGDDGRNDYMRRETAKGNVEVVCDHEHVNRSKLRCDNLKWLLSRLLPKEYGDKMQHDITAPIVEIVRFAEPAAPEQPQPAPAAEPTADTKAVH